MNLLSRTAEFEKRCSLSLKKMSWDPSIPTSKPRWEMPPFDKLDDFGIELMEFDVEKHPGTSLNFGQLAVAGNALRLALQDYKKDAKSIGKVLEALEEILTVTRNGGGSLYAKAKDFYTQVQKIMNPTPSPVKPAPKKTPAPAAWLNNYMSKNKSPGWLDQYMAGEQAAEQADENIAGMQASLDAGNSVQDVLKRTL